MELKKDGLINFHMERTIKIIQLLKKYNCSCGFTLNIIFLNKRNFYELKRLDTNDIKIK